MHLNLADYVRIIFKRCANPAISGGRLFSLDRRVEAGDLGNLSLDLEPSRYKNPKWNSISWMLTVIYICSSKCEEGERVQVVLVV